MKKYNVMVLTMSTLSNPLNSKPRNPFDNTYIYQEYNYEDKSFRTVGREYHGIGQLEPVPQYVLDKYGVITHYIILATDSVTAPLNYDWDEINNKINESGINGQIEYEKGEEISAVTFFEKRIEAFHREKGVEEMPTFKVIGLLENDPDPGVGLGELLEYVRTLYKSCIEENPGENIDDCWKMFVDIHGGLRATSFASFTLIQILSAPDMDDEMDLVVKSGESSKQYISRLTDGKPTIPVTKIYTVNYDQSNPKLSYIVDQTNLYKVYARESIEAYMNYGQYAQMALRSSIDPSDNEVKPYAFISYRRADAPKERFTFIGTLKKAGFRYWYDDSIPVLVNWKDTLETAIKNSSIFIALISKGYYSSYQCLKEMAQAIKQGKTILLVSIDQTPLYSPITGDDDNITLKDSDNEVVTIKKSELEDRLLENHQSLTNNIRDGIFQPSAIIDKLTKDNRFKELIE